MCTTNPKGWRKRLKKYHVDMLDYIFPQKGAHETPWLDIRGHTSNSGAFKRMNQQKAPVFIAYSQDILTVEM